MLFVMLPKGGLHHACLIFDFAIHLSCIFSRMPVCSPLFLSCSVWWCLNNLGMPYSQLHMALFAALVAILLTYLCKSLGHHVWLYIFRVIHCCWLQYFHMITFGLKAKDINCILISFINYIELTGFTGFCVGYIKFLCLFRHWAPNLNRHLGTCFHL